MRKGSQTRVWAPSHIAGTLIIYFIQPEGKLERYQREDYPNLDFGPDVDTLGVFLGMAII